MEASIVDLRYRMNDILKALDRNEEVHILYYGKEKGVIIPAQRTQKKIRVQELPYFGMSSEDSVPVEQRLKELRRGRYSDI